MTDSGGDAEADRYQHLRDQASEKSERAHAAVERALIALEARGKAINFETVAEAAGVSKGYLYANATFRKKIADKRKPPPPPVPPSRSAQAARSVGQQTKLDASTREIKRLRAENAQLRSENERLRGDLAAARRL